MLTRGALAVLAAVAVPRGSSGTRTRIILEARSTPENSHLVNGDPPAPER